MPEVHEAAEPESDNKPEHAAQIDVQQLAENVYRLMLREIREQRARSGQADGRSF
jgi:hypothetical protein